MTPESGRVRTRITTRIQHSPQIRIQCSQRRELLRVSLEQTLRRLERATNILQRSFVGDEEQILETKAISSV